MYLQNLFTPDKADFISLKIYFRNYEKLVACGNFSFYNLSNLFSI